MKKKISAPMGATVTRYYCDKCEKEITHEEAFRSSFDRRKKLNGEDPRIFDVWFEDWCTQCVDNWNPYGGG